MSISIDQKLLELKSLCRKSSGGLETMRYIFIIMIIRNIKEETISNILNICDRTKDEWWRRYHEKGHNGLKDLSRSGRPSKLTEEQEKEIFNFVKSSAMEESTEKIRTTDIILKKISDNFNKTYSKSGIYNFLHRIGLSKVIPRPIHIKNDPEKTYIWIRCKIYAWDSFY